MRDLTDSFWGDLAQRTRLAWKKYLEADSARQRDVLCVVDSHDRPERRQDYRNGYYVRDFVTRMGTLQLRIARSRRRAFLPRGLERFQRRAPEVMVLIREAFLRGISTRQVGRFDGHADGGDRQRAEGVPADPGTGAGRGPLSSGRLEG